MSKKMTPTQMRAKIRQLANTAREALYEQIRLTHTLLQNVEYCDSQGGYDALLGQIEREDFAHFGGSPSLAAILRAYQANPAKATWAKYNYHLKAMIALAQPDKEPGISTRTNWRARCEQLEAELATLRAELTAAKQEAKAEAQRAARLEARLELFSGRVAA